MRALSRLTALLNLFGMAALLKEVALFRNSQYLVSLVNTVMNQQWMQMIA